MIENKFRAIHHATTADLHIAPIVSAAAALCAKLRESIKPIKNTDERLIPMVHVDEIARLAVELEAQLGLASVQQGAEDYIALAVSERCGISLTDEPAFSESDVRIAVDNSLHRVLR